VIAVNMPAILSPDEWQSLRLSLLVATVAVTASLPLGIVVGWVLARGRFWGKTLLDVLVGLPLVMPPVVTGYLLLVLFGRQGVIGYWLDRWLGIRVVFTWEGAALASAVVAFPLMVRAIRVAFAGIDPRLYSAARTLGAGPIDAFVSVMLPMARNGIIGGSVLAFARSMGEFGATIMIAGNIPGLTRTVPLYIYNLLEEPEGFSAGWRLVAVSVLVSAIAMYIGERLEWKRV
jgi:molybdate transport system permease protein